MKKFKDWEGKLVRLRHDVPLNSGAVHPAGAVFRVSSTWRGRLVLEGVGAGPKATIRHLPPGYVEALDGAAPPRRRTPVPKPRYRLELLHHEAQYLLATLEANERCGSFRRLAGQIAAKLRRALS